MKYRNKQVPEWRKAKDTKRMFFYASVVIAVICLIVANIDKIKGLF